MQHKLLIQHNPPKGATINTMSNKQKIVSLTLKLRALEKQSYIDVKYWRERARSAEARLDQAKATN